MSAKPGVEDVTVLRQQLKQGRNDGLMAVQPSPELPHPRHAVTNAELLLKILQPLLEDDAKFSYLPTTITSHILRELQELRASLPLPDSEDGWSAKSAEELTALLRRLDAFYAYCLQYGIISFGFNPKIAQEHITELRGVLEVAKARGGDLDTEISRVTQTFEAKGQELSSATAEVRERLIGEMTSHAEAIKAVAVTAENQTTNAATQAAEIGRYLEASRKLSGQMETSMAAITAIQQNVVETQVAVQARIDAIVKSLQSGDADVKTLAANARAMEQSITEAKAAATNQLEAIAKFYGDIESHKQEMLKTRKESQASFNELKERSENTISDFSERTASLLETNEGMVDQIKEHLRKAVGVTLFTAFDRRRSRVFAGTMLWGVLLFLSTGGALGYAIWFVSTLSEVIRDGGMSLVLARLIIAAPIGFLIAFCAKQYGRERRAGEEYAFKSAISVSLEPYRDLLVRMHKDNPGVETDFVRQLMLEIFDNPAKRLYTKSKADSESVETRSTMMHILEKALDKVPGAE